ncbi:PREDICTED: tumor necrosis factor alpha-induced protein 8-like protein isoform X1 [Acromyrmex echinatior]|nr:PREDICTED: tumor necrosis factor alpha-induced protein 8-like protein isoform X1 [Acromyrmex echinatior]XP_011058553.1 PREDICTED: tumor necrosis factor alpha-induced protein 8-like protein isoform X1 [Acromyrmex echinatior]
MELQSWLLYHLVAVTDCNQVMQSVNTIGSSGGGGGGGSYSAGGGTGSRTRDLGLRAQKKLLGRIMSTNAGRSLFIDDATTSLLDNLYKLMESVTKSNPHLDKKEPEKVLKNIVKLSIKIGLVQRSHQFRSNDAEKLEEIREALGTVAMTVVSFYEVDYSYDQEYLTGSMERCRTLLQQLIKPHLTDKSSQRCDQVFDFLAYPKFLDSVFRYDSEHRPILGMLVSDLNKALDARRL